MNIVKAHPAEPIRLGRQGEKGVTRVEFDLLLFVQEHGQGTAQLLVKRAGETVVYPADLDQSGTTATWDIGAEWTAAAGCGYCELNWFVGDTLAKSEVYRTEVLRSLEGETMDDAPDPVSGYVAQVLEAAARAEAAQGAAEAAQSAAKASQTAAETVNAAVAELDACRYDAYPTDTQSGNFAAYTDVGADNIPPKKMTVSRGSSSGSMTTSVTIRQLGKNLFDSSEDAFEVGSVIRDDGTIESNPNYAHSKAYTPVLPNTDYVFSGRVVGKKTANTVAFYDAKGVFLSRYTPQNANGATAFNTPAQFRTPPECRFIRYNTSYNVFECDDVQLEVGKTATAYEPYDPTDYKVALKNSAGVSFRANYRALDLLKGIGLTFSGTEIRFDPPTVKTKLGANYFFVVNGTGENEQAGSAATLYAVFRLDPTLAYDKLKAAIVAAGTT